MTVVWNGALETQATRAQQRQPPPEVPVVSSTRQLAQQVAAFLQKFPQAWTLKEMAKLLQMDVEQVYECIRCLRMYVEAQDPSGGVRGRPQRYRWRR
jgi:hypothetical protein